MSYLTFGAHPQRGGENAHLFIVVLLCKHYSLHVYLSTTTRKKQLHPFYSSLIM